MPPEKVEQGARATFAASGSNRQWLDLCGDDQDRWRDFMRIAITVLREPAAAMIKAGGIGSNVEGAAYTWRRMSKAALRE